MVARRAAVQLDLLSMVRTTARSRIHIVRRPSAEVAAERLYELMCLMGQDHNGQEHGWKAEVARKLGLNAHTVYGITCAAERGDLHGVHPKTVDHAITSTGIPPAAFYDSEYKK